MAYTLDYGLSLGEAFAGLTDLRAQLVSSVGANVGGAISTGFVDMLSGNYLWHYTAFPDNHRGGVRFYSNAAPLVTLAFFAINPEEVEVSSIVASIFAGTADGESLTTHLTNLRALARGLVSSVNNGDGTFTLTFKKADGSTTAFTITYSPTTGART